MPEMYVPPRAGEPDLSISSLLKRHPFAAAAHFDRAVALSFAFPEAVVRPLVSIVFAVAQLDTQTLRRWTPWAYLLGVLLLVAVDVAGIGAKGAQRWLAIPGLPRFQPSEIMKLVMPMMVASFLAATVLPPRRKSPCLNPVV